MEKPEQYYCDSECGDFLEVGSDGGYAVICLHDATSGPTGEVHLKPEDIPRLIAQLQEAQDELSGNAEQLPDEDTIEVRIAVVTTVDESGTQVYAAYGFADGEQDMALAKSYMRADTDSILSASWVTARVPLPQTVVHEAKGEVEQITLPENELK